MKTGLTLVELATEVERRANAKKDYVVSTENLRMEATGGDASEPGANQRVNLVLAERETVAINDVAHRQIGEYADIPAKYYDRMRAEAPGLLAMNVNNWMRDKPTKRLVRTLDGIDRAFLSDRYRPLENEELAQAVLPPLLDMGVEVMSAQITDKRFYLKVVDPKVTRDLPFKMGEGHHITRKQCAALVITNSEVGYGALSINAAVMDRWCTNLAVFSQHSMKKYHVGGNLVGDIGDNMMHLLSDETRKLTDKALWAQVGDVVRGAFDEAVFNSRVDEILGLQECKIEGDPLKVVEFTAKKFGMTAGEQTSILRHLIEGADLSAYGIYNAVTRTAEDLTDYDRASDFEKIGGKLIDLPKAEWRELAKAA
jgi:hypothetical protein